MFVVEPSLLKKLGTSEEHAARKHKRLDALYTRLRGSILESIDCRYKSKGISH
jgi:hypothetical protein